MRFTVFDYRRETEGLTAVSGWRYGWRLLLALALVATPLPRAGADPGMAASSLGIAAMPCHVQTVEPASAADDGCPLDCCPEPACAPEHCPMHYGAALLPASGASTSRRMRSSAFLPVLSTPDDTPWRRRLRPPIA